VVSCESSLIKGEVRRFSTNFAHPARALVKIQRHLIQLLAIGILIPNASMKIHCAVGIGCGVFALVSTMLQASLCSCQYRGAFIAPLPIAVCSN
jgi:hypothetical protein